MVSIHPRHHVRRRRALPDSLSHFQYRIDKFSTILAAIGIDYSEVAAQEATAMKVAALVVPHRLGAVMEEARRREDVFALAASSHPGRLHRPRIAALQSVMDDLSQGRFA